METRLVLSAPAQEVPVDRLVSLPCPTREDPDAELKNLNWAAWLRNSQIEQNEEQIRRLMDIIMSRTIVARHESGADILLKEVLQATSSDSGKSIYETFIWFVEDPTSLAVIAGTFNLGQELREACALIKVDPDTQPSKTLHEVEEEQVTSLLERWKRNGVL